jgi:hypothetical protein
VVIRTPKHSLKKGQQRQSGNYTAGMFLYQAINGYIMAVDPSRGVIARHQRSRLKSIVVVSAVNVGKLLL